ncbi:hypothetical protein [Aeromonas hydrophila]|uniref:hypothetical protein n=1 Tax=Aeromonas hydrophila TaxID=644 RepID=UPI0024426581|nr:hypothetical protein [Aeromonas hydrophila]
MIKHIKDWYNGEVKIDEFDNDSDGSLYIMPMIYTKYHWTAKIARNIVSFYLKHWQWVWTTTLGFFTLYAAILALK